MGQPFAPPLVDSVGFEPGLGTFWVYCAVYVYDITMNVIEYIELMHRMRDVLVSYQGVCEAAIAAGTMVLISSLILVLALFKL